MKNKFRRFIACLLVIMLMSSDMTVLAESVIKTLTLPTALQIIEEEAFYGNTSIEKVVVPDGTTEIHSKAFADSSLTEIELPDTLTFIADDAFEGCGEFKVIVPTNCYAYNWCLTNGLLDVPVEAPASDFAYNEYDDYVEITGYSGEGGNIAIPEKINGKPVRKIGNRTFYSCESLQRITIPDSVTEIGEYAFYYCDDLEAVDFSENLTSIGKNAFYYCKSITDVELPANVETIESSTFNNCYKLTSIVLPEKLRVISGSAFSGCSSLKNIIIPEGTTTICSNAFYGCSSLQEVVLPDTVTVLENSVFYHCYGLKKVVLSKNLTEIDGAAFAGCTGLTEIVIHNKVSAIRYNAFSGCTNLKSVTIPASVETFGTTIFANCSTDLVIYGVTGSKAEEYAEEYGIAFVAIKPAELPAPTSVIAEAKSDESIQVNWDEVAGASGYNIYRSTSAAGIYVKVQTITSGSILNYTDTGLVSNTAYYYKVSAFDTNGESMLSSYAFTKTNTLSVTSVTLNKTNLSMKVGEFATLTAVINPSNASNKSLNWTTSASAVAVVNENGVITAKGVGTATIKATATDGSGKYASCIVTVSQNAVTQDAYFTYEIRNNTYARITKYVGTDVHVVVPAEIGGYPVNTISGSAFADTNVISVFVSEGIKEIGSWAFDGCSALNTVYLPDSLNSLGSCAFYECSSLISVNIPAKLSRIEGRTFMECSSLKNIALPNGVSYIGERAFFGCSSMERINLPEVVNTIESRAFYECGNLVATVIKDSYAHTWCEANSVKYVINGSESTLPVPENVTASAQSSDSIRISWDKVNDAEGYYIYRSTSSSGTYSMVGVVSSGSTQNWTNIGLAANTTYYYKVSAYSGTVESAKSSYVSAKTGVILVSSISLNQSSLNMVIGDTTTLAASITPSDATNQMVNWTTDAPAIATVDSNGVVTAIGVGTATITAMAADGSDEYAICIVSVSEPVPSIPTGVTAAAMSSNSIVVSWNAVEGAVGYHIYRSDTGNIYTKVHTITSADTTSWVNTGLDADTLYYYKVCAYNTSYESSLSGHASCRTPAIAVMGVTVTPDSLSMLIGEKATLSAEIIPDNATNQKLNWTTDASAVATVDSNGVVTAIGVGMATIKAESVYDSSKYAVCVVTISEPILATPTNVMATAQLNSIKVTWNKIDDAAGYYVYRSTGSNDAYNLQAVIQSRETTSWIDTNIVANTTYYYKVSAYNSSQESELSAYTSCVIETSGTTSVDAFKYTIVNNRYAKITEYIGDETNVVVPSMIDNVPVYSIDSYTFKNCSELESVILPEGLSSIGYEAFRGCTSLINVYLPDSLKSIGQYAFYGCTKLASISFPEKLESIGNSAFSGCTALKSITFRGGNPSIGDSAFSGCKLLESVTFSGSLNSVGSSAFNGCVSLKSISLPRGLLSISDYAFEGCTGLTSVTLPYGLTSIGYRTFRNCTSLTSVYLAEGLTTIGGDAFSGCTKLPSVVFPNDLVSVGSSAFYGCTALKSVTFQNGSPKIGSSAFSGCKVLEDVVFYDSVGTVDSSAFSGCISLESISLPKGLLSLGSSAFSGCTSLKNVYLPNGLQTIGDYAFEGCTGLAHITLPNGVTSIGYRSFRNCTGLVSIYMPDGLTDISSDAFAGCIKLSAVDFPNGLISVGSSAFYGCTALKSIIFQNGSPAIGSSAFSGCKLLETVAFYDSLASIGSSAFSGCVSLKSITLPEGLLTLSDYVFEGCTGLASVILPNNLTTIGYRTFRNCTGLKKIWIPDTIIANGINSDAFSNISTDVLTIYGVAGSVAQIFAESKGVGFNANGLDVTPTSKPTLHPTVAPTTTPTIKPTATPTVVPTATPTAVPVVKPSPTSTTATRYFEYSVVNSEYVKVTKYIGNDTTVVIPSMIEGLPVKKITDTVFDDCIGVKTVFVPEHVLAIDNYTFEGCSELESVVLPEGLSSIGYRAFRNCTSLSSVYLPSSLKSIDSDAFAGCYNLTSITFPSALNSIGGSAFNNCTALKNVVFKGGNPSIGSSAFSGCKLLESVTFNGSLDSVGSSAFSGCVSLKSITLPRGLLSISDYAFEGCTGLTSVTLPYGLTSIGYRTFRNCTSLTSVYLAEGLTTIGGDAFSGCTKLPSVVFPNDLVSVGSGAFYGCTALKSVTFQDGSPKIGSSAFSGCKVLEDVVFYDSIGTVDSSAFSGCISLESISLPKGLLSLGSSAFSGCTSLKNMSLPNGLQTIGDYAFEGCTGLAHITLPNGVTSIGYRSFRNCTGLTSIYMPDGLTDIGSDAFSGCIKLTAVDFPNGLASIGGSAFYGCTALKSIIFQNGSPAIGSSAFSGCKLLETVAFYDSLASIGSSAFSGCVSLKSITLPEGLLTLSDYVFEGCTGLASVILPNNLTTIGYRTFRNCTGLKKIWIPDTIIANGINSDAFSNISTNVLTIYGVAGSVAQTFAESKGFGFNASSIANNTPKPSVSGYKLSTYTVNEGSSFTLSGTINGNGSKVSKVTISAFVHGDHTIGVHLQSLTGNSTTFDLSRFSPIKTDCVYSDSEGRVMALSGGNTYDIVIYATLANGEYFRNDTNPTQTIVVKKETVDAPDVLSVKFDSDSTAVNEAVGITVETDVDAEQLYMYAEDRSWGRCGSWATFDSDTTVDGDKRIWNIKYAFNTTGDRTLTFYASKDGRNEGEGCDASIEVYEPVYTGISVEDFTLSQHFVQTGDTIELNGIVRGHGSNLSEVAIMLVENEAWDNAVYIASYTLDDESFDLGEETDPIVVGETYGRVSTYRLTSRSTASDSITMADGNDYQVVVRAVLENGEVLNDGYGYSRFLRVQNNPEDTEITLEKVEFTYVPEKVNLYEAREGIDVTWDDSQRAFYKLEYKLDTESEYRYIINNYGHQTIYFTNVGKAKEVQLRLSAVSGSEAGEATTETIPIQTLGELSFTGYTIGENDVFDVSRSSTLTVPVVCENAVEYKIKGIFINEYPSGSDQSGKAVDTITSRIEGNVISIPRIEFMKKLGGLITTDSVKAPYFKLAVTPYDEEGNAGTTRWIGFKLVNGRKPAARVSFNNDLPEVIESGKTVTISWTPTSDNVLYYNLYYRHNTWEKSNKIRVEAPKTSAEICVSDSNNGYVFLSLYAVLTNDNHSHVDKTIAFAKSQSTKNGIEQLRLMLPDGEYWCHTPGKEYDVLAARKEKCECNYKHGLSRPGTASHPDLSGSCGCNAYSGALQCQAYARLICDQLFGSNPGKVDTDNKTVSNSAWKTTVKYDDAKVGDFVFNFGIGHAYVVSAVEVKTDSDGKKTTIVKITDCNYQENCRIRWDVTLSTNGNYKIFRYDNNNSEEEQNPSDHVIEFKDFTVGCSSTRAYMYAQAVAPESGSYTEFGLRLMDSQGKEIIERANASSSTSTSKTKTVWFDLLTNADIKLAPATQYKCQLYTVYNGNKYWSAEKTFETLPMTTIDHSISTSAMVANLQNCTNNSILPSDKKEAMVTIAKYMLDNGFDPAFVAGIIGNIRHEASFGIFESSAYSSNKPEYLAYMDNLYNYREKYSGKLIYNGISLSELDALMDTLSIDNYSKGKFGLGCVQWTGGRTSTLVDLYVKHAGASDTINSDQVVLAEEEMIYGELTGQEGFSNKKTVVTNWKTQNTTDLYASDAAYDAGYRVCVYYEVPANYRLKGIVRGETAYNLYLVMMGIE